MKKVIIIAMLGMCSSFALAGVDSIRQSGDRYDNINPGSTTLPTGGSTGITSQSLKQSLEDRTTENATNAENVTNNENRIVTNTNSLNTTNSSISSLQGQYNGHESRIRALEAK